MALAREQIDVLRKAEQRLRDRASELFEQCDRDDDFDARSQAIEMRDEATAIQNAIDELGGQVLAVIALSRPFPVARERLPSRPGEVIRIPSGYGQQAFAVGDVVEQNGVVFLIAATTECPE